MKRHSLLTPDHHTYYYKYKKYMDAPPNYLAFPVKGIVNAIVNVDILDNFGQ